MMQMACELPPSGLRADLAKRVSGQVPELRSERLVLRAPLTEDFDAYAQIACTDRGRFLGGPMPRDEAWLDFAQMVAGWLLQGHGLWTVCDPDGTTQGFVVIGLEPGDLEPELGFMFLPHAEGKGIAQEAARSVLSFANRVLGFATLVCYIDATNARAIALARALGGFPDGEIKEDGGAISTSVYRIKIMGVH